MFLIDLSLDMNSLHKPYEVTVEFWIIKSDNFINLLSYWVTNYSSF